MITMLQIKIVKHIIFNRYILKIQYYKKFNRIFHKPKINNLLIYNIMQFSTK